MDSNDKLDKNLNYHDLSIVFDDHIIKQLLDFLHQLTDNKLLFDIYKKCKLINYLRHTQRPVPTNIDVNAINEFWGLIITNTVDKFNDEYKQELDSVLQLKRLYNKSDQELDRNFNRVSDLKLKALLNKDLLEFTGKDNITTTDLRTLYEKINSDIHNWDAKFRLNNNVAITNKTGFKFIPIDYTLISTALAHIFLELESVLEKTDNEFDRIVVILKFFYDLVAIQPFNNGNTHAAMQILMRELWKHCPTIQWLRCSPLIVEAIVDNKWYDPNFSHNYYTSFSKDLLTWYTTNASSSVRNIRFWLATIIQCYFEALTFIYTVYQNNSDSFTLSERSFITNFLRKDYYQIKTLIAKILTNPDAVNELVLSSK